MADFSVTTTCSTCGSIPVEPTSIRLHLQDQPMSYFSCACPSCGQLLGGTVGTQVALGLAGRGATISELPFSPELLERPKCGPIDPDEMIEFHYLLERKDWFDILQRSLHPGEV
ncbi:MAG TPA: hypothetical protein VI541_02475 [Actinomycetota bacterium]|nr:hypothetical protein [Actinomycetota bacterium]